MREKNASPEFVAIGEIGVVGAPAARYAADKGERSMSEFRAKFWGRQMDDLMTEMGRQATICKVKLLLKRFSACSGVLERLRLAMTELPSGQSNAPKTLSWAVRTRNK